jgi:hypothetical protein
VSDLGIDPAAACRAARVLFTDATIRTPISATFDLAQLYALMIMIETGKVRLVKPDEQPPEA